MNIVIPYEPLSKTDDELQYFLYFYDKYIRQHSDIKFINHRNLPVSYKTKLLLHKYKLNDSMVDVDLCNEKPYTDTEGYWALIPEVYKWSVENIGDVFLTEPDVVLYSSEFFSKQHPQSNTVYCAATWEDQYTIVQYALNGILRQYGIHGYGQHYVGNFLYTKNNVFAQRWYDKTMYVNGVANSLQNKLHKSLLLNYNEEIALSLLAGEYPFVRLGSVNSSDNKPIRDFHHCDSATNMEMLYQRDINEQPLVYSDGGYRKFHKLNDHVCDYIDFCSKHIIGNDYIDHSNPRVIEMEKMFGGVVIEGVFVRNKYNFKTM